MLKTDNYKLVLFDKDCHGVELEKFTQYVKNINKDKGLDTKLILVSSPNEEHPNKDDAKFVDEIITNSVNKDLLEELFKKYI